MNNKRHAQIPHDTICINTIGNKFLVLYRSSIQLDYIRKTSELFDSLRLVLFGLIFVRGYKWSWRDLNPTLQICLFQIVGFDRNSFETIW